MRKNLKMYKNTLIQWAGLLLVIMVFGIWSQGNLFSEYNRNAIIETVTPLVLICSGMTFIFAHGGMDISSGAVVALASLVSIRTINATGSLPLGILMAMAAAVLCYILNAVVTNKFGLMAVITSLAIMFSARGLVSYICQQTPNDSISVTTVSLELFKKNHNFMIILMIAVVIFLTMLFYFTELGKGAKAIGDNQLAAGQNGVPVDLTKLKCYIVAGLCVGTAAVFKYSAVGKVQSSTGNGLEMDVLVVVVLGGMSLSGGANTRISSAVVGAFTYVILLKGLTIIGMDPNMVVLVKAVIFLAIIYLTTWRDNLKIMPK